MAILPDPLRDRSGHVLMPSDPWRIARRRKSTPSPNYAWISKGVFFTDVTAVWHFSTILWHERCWQCVSSHPWLNVCLSYRMYCFKNTRNRLVMLNQLISPDQDFIDIGFVGDMYPSKPQQFWYRTRNPLQSLFKTCPSYNWLMQLHTRSRLSFLVGRTPHTALHRIQPVSQRLDLPAQVSPWPSYYERFPG